MKYSIVIVFLSFFFAISAQTTIPPDMVFVQGGTFTMGCTPDQVPGCDPNLSSSHIVRLPSFWIGKYEVTQAQWEAVMGNDNPPPHFNNNPDHPMDSISFSDCLTFCNRLSELYDLEPVYYFDKYYIQVFDTIVIGNQPGQFLTSYIKTDSKGFRLPLESEWEFAARGGVISQQQTKYSGSNNLDEVAWFSGNSGGITHIVGSRIPNSLNIFDMSGNVSEIIYDLSFGYGEDIALGDCVNYFKIARGGLYIHNFFDDLCFVSSRGLALSYTSSRFRYNGIRICRSL